MIKEININPQSAFYLSEAVKQIIKPEDLKFTSWNCGLNSTERKNKNRICKALDILQELNRNNIKNDLFFYNIRQMIYDYLNFNGLKVVVNSKDNYKIVKMEGVVKE